MNKKNKKMAKPTKEMLTEAVWRFWTAHNQRTYIQMEIDKRNAVRVADGNPHLELYPAVCKGELEAEIAARECLGIPLASIGGLRS